ncbi:hypothetical protein KBD08_02985 [Candidatus Babeliales bacterium]|nr:hypothetical protein [Candidatus Babeliales bacterium]
MRYINRYLIVLLSITSLHASQQPYEHEQSEQDAAKKGLLDDALKAAVRKLIPTGQQPISIKVQESPELGSDERDFLTARKKITQKTLADKFKITKPLNIEICCSGGGMRAALGALGVLRAADKTGILSATNRVAATSGSTWMISSVFALKAKYPEKSTQEVLNIIQKGLEKRLQDPSQIKIPGQNNAYLPPLLPFNLTDDFWLGLATRWGYNQPCSLVDIFGPVVANAIMSDMQDRTLDATWSSVASYAKTGQFPLPICSTIFETEPGTEIFAHCETTPFEFGCPLLGYIPTKIVGTPFVNKQSDTKQLKPEYPLAYWDGAHGSAFSVQISTLERVLQPKDGSFLSCCSDTSTVIGSAKAAVLSTLNIQGRLDALLQNIRNERLPAMVIPNYRQDVVPHDTLNLMDAGIDINIPVTHFFDRKERKSNIIFMFEAAHKNRSNRRKLYDYAQKAGALCPEEWAGLPNSNEPEQVITVYNDPNDANYNPNMATFIYLPMVDPKNPQFDTDALPFDSINFRYTADQIKYLTDLMEQNFTSNIKAITQIMQQVSEKHA